MVLSLSRLRWPAQELRDQELPEVVPSLVREAAEANPDLDPVRVVARAPDELEIRPEGALTVQVENGRKAGLSEGLLRQEQARTVTADVQNGDAGRARQVHGDGSRIE